MNAALLLAPWRVTPATLRWVGVLVFVAALVGAAALAVHSGARGAVNAVALYAFASAYLGAFALSPGVLLAIDAHQLRLPRAARAVAWSVLAGAVLLVALPTTVIALIGGPVLMTAMLVGAALAAGLAYALLPGYAGYSIAVAPMVFNALGLTLHFPVWTPPRLAVAGAVVLAISLLAILIQWPRLLRGAGSDVTGMRRPMVLQFRNKALMRLQVTGVDANQRIRQQPAWLQPEIATAGTGPAHPVTSLRVALGGWYAPQTRQSWLRQLRNRGVLVGLIFGSMVMLRLDHPGRSLGIDLLQTVAGAFVGIFLVMATLGTPLITAATLHRRWSSNTSELALLTLLPGLPQGDRLRRRLLRAALGRPLAIHAGMLAASLLAAAVFHMAAPTTLVLVLAQLYAALATVSAALATLGDRVPGPWSSALLIIAFTSLLSITGCVVAFSYDWLARGDWSHARAVEAGFVLADVLLGALLLWLARRGWQGLQQRPHPFMPIGRRSGFPW